jgi:HAD superfamily hydrolase (TIGR01509 family)
MARTGIIFDVDGTLVDSNYLHTVAWSRAMRDAGEHVPMSTIHRYIGMGSDRLVEEMLGHENDKASELHSKHFKEFKAEMQAIPGAADLLAEVKRRGAMVVLATSAKEADVEAMVDAIGAPDGCIDHVTHAGDVGESKPAPDVFQVALEASGLSPADAMVVGDTVWDVESAARSGLSCVAVLSGGIGRQELEEAGAKAVYEDAADLLRQLDDSPLGHYLPG